MQIVSLTDDMENPIVELRAFGLSLRDEKQEYLICPLGARLHIFHVVEQDSSDIQPMQRDILREYYEELENES